MKNFKTPQEFKRAVQQHIDDLAILDQQMYDHALSILRNPSNYTGHQEGSEQAKLLAAIDCLSKLFTRTGDCPHHHLSAVNDLTKEDQVQLYPMTFLKYSATKDLKELYVVSEEIFRLGVAVVA